MRRIGIRRTRHATALLILGMMTSLAWAADDQVPFDGVKDQFTISLPAGWSAYNQSEAVFGKPGPGGVIFFSAQPLTKPGEKTADADLLAKADSGEISMFFVDRLPAAKGMACAEFSRAAGGKVAGMARRDPTFAEGRELPKQFLPKKIDLGGCHGFKVELHAVHDKPVRTERVVDVRAVSDGKVLYLFSVRTTAERYEKILPTFESALATVKISSPM